MATAPTGGALLIAGRDRPLSPPNRTVAVPPNRTPVLAPQYPGELVLDSETGNIWLGSGSGALTVWYPVQITITSTHLSTFVMPPSDGSGGGIPTPSVPIPIVPDPGGVIPPVVVPPPVVPTPGLYTMDSTATTMDSTTVTMDRA